MKRFLTLLVMFFMGVVSWAKAPDILVLPLFMTNSQNFNSYGFETVSEIVASEVNYNLSYTGKFVIDDFGVSKALYQDDNMLMQIGEKYKKNGLIDFESLVSLVKKSSTTYTLLILGYAEDKNKLILDAWDALKLASDFDVILDYDLLIKLILVDNNDGIVVWQKTYLTPLSSENKPYKVTTYSQALEQYQKISSYSKNIVAKDVEHNLTLKFYPKKIDFKKNISQTLETQEGIGLKYYKKTLIPLTKITQPSETMEERLLKEDSFSL